MQIDKEISPIYIYIYSSNYYLRERERERGQILGFSSLEKLNPIFIGRIGIVKSSVATCCC